jgi:hypothetical protein
MTQPIKAALVNVIALSLDFEKYENIPQEWEPPTTQVENRVNCHLNFDEISIFYIGRCVLLYLCVLNNGVLKKLNTDLNFLTCCDHRKRKINSFHIFGFGSTFCDHFHVGYVQEYVDQGNLSDWLLEPDAADQFRYNEEFTGTCVLNPRRGGGGHISPFYLKRAILKSEEKV